MHKVVMGQNDIMIQIDMKDSFWNILKTVAVGLVVAAVAILAIALTAGIIGVVAAPIMTALAALGIGGGVSVTLGTGAVILASSAGIWSAVTYYNTQLPNNVVLPTYTISPEEIFEGKILLFDVDFFNPVEEIKEKKDAQGNTIHYYIDENGEEIPTSTQNTALELQKVVSQWYMALRNIAIVLSMSVLLYTGIRMLLSTIAQDKAKYKQMIADWIVGLCLLFFMHYIMAFSVTVVKQFSKMIVYNQEQDLEDIQSYTGVIELDEEGKIKEKVKDVGQEEAIQPATKIDENGQEVDTEFLIWPTNIMGQLRIAAQMSYGDAGFIGYTICFFILVLLTIFFTFVYLKRVLYMAFLTMIAPLVALTYPIDKISDGQAQGFNRWLKEYIFNLLIQPLHLILYTVLVSSAFELASTNSIYAIVAIAFLIPAEKLMRSLFGFEKASTPPSLAGAAVGAGLLNTGLQQLLKRTPPEKGGKNGGNGSDGDDSRAPARIGYRGNNTDPLDIMAGSDNNDNDIPVKSLDSGDEPSNNDEKDPKKAMLDAYDDKYGTDEWDPAERDQMAREAYKDDGGMKYSDDEYRNILKDSGYSDEEIADMMGDNENTQKKILDSYDDKYGTDEWDPAERDQMAREAYKDDGGMKYSDDEYRNILKDSGYSDEEIAEMMGDNEKKQIDDTQASQPRQTSPTLQSVSQPRQTSSTLQSASQPKKITGSRGRAGKMTVGDKAKGAWRAMGATFTQQRKGFIRGAKQGVRKAPGVVAGAMIGGTAAVVGASLGLAAGDPSKALSYGGAGAVAGGTLGKRTFTISPRSGQQSAEKIAAERAFYGDKYDDHVAEKNMKKWRRDDEKRQELERYLGAEKVKALYKGNKDAKINEYLKNEITDAKDIAALEQLQEKKKVSFNDALVFYDAHSRYGDIPNGDVKKRKEIKADYAEKFEQRGTSKEVADKKAQDILDMTHEFDSIKKDLNKA